ncbi:DUF3299 domain-containing protein [Lutimaribacter marinistellae]|uniref:DUF3299 domain-containing protein n=1 Tax=Lutimaribacter marinistellae TaxID=1820329 RepID=A0ABV7TB33_9RHOB
MNRSTRDLKRFGLTLLVLLLAVMMSTGVPAQTSAVVTWDTLVPGQIGEASEQADRHIRTGGASLSGSSAPIPAINPFDPLATGSVVVEEWEETAYDVASNILDTRITIDGYVLPLTMENGRVVDFLLVPWVGACIHTPAPPPNQIIHVSYPEGLTLEREFDAVRLTGTLKHEPADRSLFLVDGRRNVPASYALAEATLGGQPGKVIASSVSDVPLAARAQIWISTLFTDSMTAFGKNGSWNALVFALLISFGYGALHTLGPGHGKAVIVSYFVGSGGSLTRGLKMGTRIAVFHVLSSVVLVFLLDFAVRQTTGAAPSDYRAIRLGSYALIVLIGAFMLWQALASVRARKSASTVDCQAHAHGHTHEAHGHTGCAACSAASGPKGSGWVAAAIGIVPCTGALLVMLFGLANDLVGPAIAMVVAISLGMAASMSAIGIAALWGRGWAERRFGSNDAKRVQFETGARLAGATCVLIIGLLLFWMTFSGENNLAVRGTALAEQSSFKKDSDGES